MTSADRWKDVISGRYRLVHLLGTGGMAEVHLAKAIGTGGFEKLVALKLLAPGEYQRRGHADALRREAFIGAHIDHDNVVQVLDFGEDRGRSYVVMEYVRGFSLRAVLRHAAVAGSELPPRVVVHIVRAIAGALEHIHGLTDPSAGPLDLIHGDVTPSNVLLSRDGRIKLADFGIAALAGELAGQIAVAGKPRYLPPEVLAGAAQSQATDVYSLGAVLYEGLAGSPAFAGTTVAEIRQAQQRGAAPIGARRPDCPAPLAEVVMLAVSQRPASRYRSARSLRRALDQALPKQLDDAEVHRAFIAATFADERFVATHGELPSTGSLDAIRQLPPHVSSHAEDETAVPQSRPTALRFGLSPALSGEVAQQSGERLGALLARRLGVEVHTIVLADYQALVDCLSKSDVDFAWTPPQAFLEVFQRGGGMLTIMMRSGRVSYESAIIVRADSSCHSLQDLRGQSAAWVDRRSASGYLFARAALIEQLGPGEQVLAAEHFHGTHRAVCEAVLNGWAGFGATYVERGEGGEAVASGWSDLLPERAGGLRPLAFLGPIPADNIAHAPELDPLLVQQLISALTALHQSTEGQAVLAEALGAEQLVYGGFELYRGLIVASETVAELQGGH